MLGNHRPIGRAGAYRHHARDCLEAALHAADVDACGSFLELAFTWTRLAKRVEASGPRPDDVAGKSQPVQLVIIRPRRG